MWKTVIAGTTVLAIAGATLAFADQGSGKSDHAQRWRPNAADITAFGDARIAALKAGLQLTAEQEKNWPAVETAMRDLAKQRADRFASRANAERPKDPVERLMRHAESMERRGAALKKLADAAGPLYQSLNEDQKHRFTLLARMGGRHFGGRHFTRSHHGWRGHGHDGLRHHARSDRRGPERGPQPQ